MIYIISGKEPYLIDLKINTIIKENGGDIIKIDGDSKEFSYDYVIESCTSLGLFSNKSVVSRIENNFPHNLVQLLHTKRTSLC